MQRRSVGARLKGAMRESATATLLCGAMRADAAARGIWGRYFTPKRVRSCRRICRRTDEGSAFLGWSRAAIQSLFREPLSAYGAVFFLSCLLLMLGEQVRGGSFFEGSAVFFMVGMISSLLLLRSSQSLAEALAGSHLLRWTLAVREVARDTGDHALRKSGRRGRGIFLCALAIGCAGWLFSPLRVLLWIGFLAVAVILFFAPELFMLLLFSLLPFLNFLPHPTLALAAAVAAIELPFLFKLLCGRAEAWVGALETSVLFLCVLYVLGGVDGLVMSALMLSFFVAERYFSRRQWSELAVAGMTVASFVCSVIGIAEYVLGKAELNWVDVSRFFDIGGRVTSLFGNPNVLAVYLLLVLPILLSKCLDSSCRVGQRLLFGGASSAALLCLILTWSRGAWIGAIVSIGLTVLLSYPKQWRRLLLLAGIVLMWLPLMPKNVRNRFASIGNMAESSIRYRLYTWRGCLKMAWQRPFGIGVGERAFALTYPRYAVSGTERVTHSHNLFLQITAELGVIGILSFLAFLFFLVQLFCTCFFKRNGHLPPLVIGSFSAVIGCLTMGFFDYVWYHKGLFWLFWITVAASVGGMRQLLAKEKDYKEKYGYDTGAE